MVQLFPELPGSPGGATGIPGPPGSPGGATGLTGATGVDGGTGPTGPFGVPGTPGDPGGATGATGPNGPEGATGATAATGATGSTGPQGDPGGATGATGPEGATGLGATGATGIDGTPGDPGGATGATGNPGFDGTNGTPGTDGATGATGVPGATGFGASGATGAQGPTGIGLPGATGADGQTGATGETGLTGATGIQGIQGVAGIQGIIGPDGATGPVGPGGSPGGATGPSGTTGATGETGGTGSTGAPGFPGGATGPDGPAGPPGSPGGATGIQGPAGDPGGATGATGTIGPVGASGPDGPIGGTGPQGATGFDGVAGPVGSTGEQGVQGLQGNQGDDGATGPEGPEGATGPIGEDGATGPQGVGGDPGGATGATGDPGVQGISQDVWEYGGSANLGTLNGFVISDGSLTNADIRHYRLSKLDDFGVDQSAWIEANFVKDAVFRIRYTLQAARAYEYTVGCISQQTNENGIDFYDIFVYNGLQLGPPTGLTGLCLISFDEFNTSKSYNFTGPAGTHPYPNTGRYVMDDPAVTDNGQANYAIITKESIYGNDEALFLDIINTATPAAPRVFYFKSGAVRFARMVVTSGFYYADTEYYAFVGETENTYGTGELPKEDWTVETQGIQYITLNDGATGAEGPAGPAGPPGGATGSTGPIGDPGGATGATGEPGATGEGATGATGPSGAEALDSWNTGGVCEMAGDAQNIYNDKAASDADIRHFRIATNDFFNADQTQWIEDNLQVGVNIRVQNTTAAGIEYSYDIVATSQLITDGAKSYFDIFVDNGAFTGTIAAPLSARVSISGDGFVTFREWAWFEYAFENHPYPVSGEQVIENPAVTGDNQTAFSIIHKTSFFGYDQSNFLDRVVAEASVSNEVLVYFQPDNTSQYAQRVTDAYYYADGEYYVLVGRTYAIYGSVSLAQSWSIATNGVIYVSYGATGVDGPVGASGATGIDGVPGLDGTPGPQGSASDTWAKAPEQSMIPNAGTIRNDGAGSQTDIRLFRLSDQDADSNFRSAWIEANFNSGAQFEIRYSIDTDRKIEYTCGGRTNITIDQGESFYDIIAYGGVRTGSNPSALTGRVQVSFDNFVTSFEFDWGNNSADERPSAGEFVTEIVGNTSDGQSNFSLISGDSSFANDQNDFLSAVLSSSSPSNPSYIYFKAGTGSFYRQTVEGAHYYVTDNYYTFVGRTEFLLGAGTGLGALPWEINVAAVSYVPPTGSGVNGSFTAASGETITVVNGIITSIL